MKKLAIHGGRPILKKPLDFFPPSPINKKEKIRVQKILNFGHLSSFVANYNNGFLGGKEVKVLEEQFCKKFKVKYAVSFNSASTALQASIAALKIGPGDEVIVSPYTMSASVTCILSNGAVPIFVDINEENYCIDPKLIEKKITKNTKAIMVVNLFGEPADFTEIQRIANKYKLKIIEDNAQAPGAIYKGRFTGAIGNIGVFSFNTHKVMQSGEGGVLITNKKEYALRAQLVRNHAEVVIDGIKELKEEIIIGSNYRMTEIEAAIASEQLLKLDNLNKKRIELAKYLTKRLEKIKGIEVYKFKKYKKNVFYVYPIKIKEKILGISRDVFVDAMAKEGFLMSKGYVKPIYLLPIFQKQQIFPNSHFPFKSEQYNKKLNYKKGICPVCEKMYEKELMFTTICQYPYTKKEVDLFISAILKIINNKEELNENFNKRK